MSTYYVEATNYSVFEKLISNTYLIRYIFYRRIGKIKNKTIERILDNLLK